MSPKNPDGLRPISTMRDRSPVDRRMSLLGDRIDLGARVQQTLDNIRSPHLRREMQRRPAPVVRQSDILDGQPPLDRGQVTIKGRIMQWRAAEFVHTPV